MVQDSLQGFLVDFELPCALGEITHTLLVLLLGTAEHHPCDPRDAYHEQCDR
jgi:hypothetical protein